MRARYIWGLSPRGRGNPGSQHPAGVARGSIPAWAGEPRRLCRRSPQDRVYPRVGGGTIAISTHFSKLTGLSPRGRGNHVHEQLTLEYRRSIPAWAGEPRLRRRPPGDRLVYPRVGGGTPNWRPWRPPCSGLSPRGRGNPGAVPGADGRAGSIPAWAGEPFVESNSSAEKRVYPRVGGGTELATHGPAPYSGLSPRGRGNRLFTWEYDQVHGSIPAWAGEPAARRGGGSSPRVYPRVGGGTNSGAPRGPPRRGLSPRGRGNRYATIVALRSSRSIPAWAGEPCCPGCQVLPLEVYPRVGGGTLRAVEVVGK